MELTAVNMVNNDGYTPLHLSVLKGSLQLVKVMFKFENIDVDAVCGVPGQRTVNCGSTALHLAAESGNLGIIEELCNKGAAIDVGNRYGHTALFIAAKCGHIDAMKLLVSKGARVNAVCGQLTPLCGAASLQCNLEAVKYLLGCGADVNPRGRIVPLSFAVQSRDAAIVEFLINNGALVKKTLLHFSVLSGSVEIVECLLRSGADVNAKDERELTPLHWAAFLGRSKIATLLLDRGADANVKRLFNITPLHCAVERRNNIIKEFTRNLRRIVPEIIRQENFEMAELLIEQGENLRAIDEEGRTPLHDAVCRKNYEWIRDYDERYRERAKLIRTLVEKGADLNARDEEGRTPLEYVKIDLKIFDGYQELFM